MDMRGTYHSAIVSDLFSGTYSTCVAVQEITSSILSGFPRDLHAIRLLSNTWPLFRSL